MVEAGYLVYGLPTSYKDIGYSETGLPKAKQLELQDKIPRAPSTGTLTIQGSAACVINHFIDLKRKVRGLDFTKLASTAFEEHNYPQSDVVLLYNVGIEVSVNTKVSSMVLQKVLKYYNGRPTLLVIETKYTKSQMLSQYDFNVTNFIKIPEKAEEIWV